MYAALKGRNILGECDWISEEALGSFDDYARYNNWRISVDSNFSIAEVQNSLYAEQAMKGSYYLTNVEKLGIQNVNINLKVQKINYSEYIELCERNYYEQLQRNLSTSRGQVNNLMDGLRKAVRKGGESTNQIGKICVTVDASNPQIVGTAGNTMYMENPTIELYGYKCGLTSDSSPSEWVDFYRKTLSTDYLDQLPEEFWIGKDRESIYMNMEKLNADIQKTKDLASSFGLYNEYGELSFTDWNVENCAEVWSARDAILNGADYDYLVFRTENVNLSPENPKWYAFPCDNCSKTFSNHYVLSYEK